MPRVNARDTQPRNRLHDLATPQNRVLTDVHAAGSWAVQHIVNVDADRTYTVGWSSQSLRQRHLITQDGSLAPTGTMRANTQSLWTAGGCRLARSRSSAVSEDCRRRLKNDPVSTPEFRPPWSRACGMCRWVRRCRDSTLTTEQWWQHETKYACSWRADPIFLASCGPTL